MIKEVIVVLLIGMSYPVALLLHKLTRDEKKIYKNYFNYLLILFAIGAGIFYFLNVEAMFTLIFLFLSILFWKRL